jgi:Kef-type K+ transport system membrane component KefB
MMMRALLLLMIPTVAWASDAGHGDFWVDLLLIALMLGVARIGGHIAASVGQPAVLGELMSGLALGAIGRAWFPTLAGAPDLPSIQTLTELGVILLLFEVGLESTVAQMLKVGKSAFAVAIIGVVLPFGMGWGAATLLMPDHSMWVHLFLGAALTATSVGITARVLQELGKSQTPEARVILGAAVIDDVLGLLILAGVTGMIHAAADGEAVSFGPVALIAGKAALFLVGGVGFGVLLAPWFYRNAARLQGGSVLLGFSLAFCFFMAGLSGWVGLAPIVGAFAAGLVLESAHFVPFTDKGEHELEELVKPVVTFLAPLFFVVMGMRVDLSVFMDPWVVALALALTVVAIIGKILAMGGVLDKGIARLPVGLGMIPRGEVGLIFANIGLGLKIAGEPVIDAKAFGALVGVVVLTTVVTPPLLAWSLRRLPPEAAPG